MAPDERRQAIIDATLPLLLAQGPDISTRVHITKDGKLIKTPNWLINYRHPDLRMLNTLRGPVEGP